MRVREAMSGSVTTIDAAEPAHSAIVRMLARRVRHLPVVDTQGALMGIVTDRDLRHYLFSPGVFERIGQVAADELLKAVTVKQVMSWPAVSIHADEDLETAARVMAGRRIGSLPVVEKGRVIGIITETDLLRHIVQTEAGSPECEAIVVSFP